MGRGQGGFAARYHHAYSQKGGGGGGICVCVARDVCSQGIMHRRKFEHYILGIVQSTSGGHVGLRRRVRHGDLALSRCV